MSTNPGTTEDSGAKRGVPATARIVGTIPAGS